MLLAVEIRGGRGDDGEVFARAANHSVAEMAEQFAHLARLVVMVYDELPRHHATDGAPPALPLVHRVVVREGDAVLGFQVYHPDALRIFTGIFAALFKATPLAYRLYAIQTRPVLVEL